MTVNVPLLRKTLEHITEHPDEWRQQSWAVQTPCGTAYCVAGHAVILAGDEIQWVDEDDDLKAADSTVDHGSIPGRAAELLGLPREYVPTLGTKCWPMFLGDNTLRDIYGHAHRLTDGEIPIPDVLPDGS